MSQKILSIGGYYGGKVQSTKKILPYLPNCDTLVSPFCGFASVELNSRAKHLVLNDANPATSAALRAIRDECRQLIMWLRSTDWGTVDFNQCKKTLQIAQSTNSYSAMFQLGYAAIAYSAMAHHRGGSISGYSTKQAARAKSRNWDYLYDVSDRLQHSMINSSDFRICFDLDLHDNSAYYLDPPYLEGGEHYQVIMTVDDHADMLDLAIATPHPVVISGYASELYDEWLKDWQRVEFSARNNHRRKRTEVLWVKS
jgi:DNA adenine methylase